MATLWIREYSTSGVAGGGRGIPVAAEPGTDQTPLTFAASSQSAAFAAGTRYIAITSSAAFHFVVGDNPTATTGALKWPADAPAFFAVKAGQKIAAIAAA